MRFRSFIGYPEISGVPANKSFSRKRPFPISISEFSKIAIFQPLTSRIEFCENWLHGYDLYDGFRLKKVIHDFP